MKSPTTTIEALARLLGDTAALASKTQGYHWNVTGPHFSSLHALFEAQYDALAEATDEVAERIRALGRPAPTGLSALLKLSAIAEETGAPTWREMLERLAEGHEQAATSARAVIALAQERGDEASADLAIGRIHEHDKAAWMLRATLS
jgi:starvation-inducible DNA-binding protein